MASEIWRLCYADLSMSNEQPEPLSDPQEILALKDSIVTQWSQLPPEHQATMALVLTQTLFDSGYGPWLVEALSLKLLNPPQSSKLDG